MKSAYNIKIKRFKALKDLGELDDQLNLAIRQDGFSYIESSLLFSFSYILLLELDEIHSFLESHRNVAQDLLYKLISDQFGVRVKDKDSYQQFISYLNDVLAVSTRVYNQQRKNVLSHSDKLLDSLVRFKSAQKKDFKHD